LIFSTNRKMRREISQTIHFFFIFQPSLFHGLEKSRQKFK